MSKVEDLEKKIRELECQLSDQKRANEGLQKLIEAHPFVNEESLSHTESEVLFRDEVDRQTSNMQIAMEQAAHANQTKSEFLERVSHDLLTPMNGMMGLTSLVLDTELTDKQRHYLEMVNTSANQVLEVVNNILDFSKIEQGKLDFDNKEFDLRESLEYELFPQKLNAQNKNIFLRFSLEPRTPVMVETDKGRLMQVVSNLVRNAILFTEEGDVHLTASADKFGADGVFFIRFSISDTGVGINPEKQKSIMESFNKGNVLPNSGSDKSMLGLAISGYLVKLVGGEIGVESDGTGAGTTVWFTWPVVVLADSSIHQTEKEYLGDTFGGRTDSDLEGVRVLVAEDDPTSSVLIETVLSLAGADVTVVADGKQAWDKYMEGGYRIVFMDIQMPEMDGFESTTNIREYEKQHGGHASVIALTALAMPGDKEKCLEGGMDDYLAKPIDKTLLIETLTAHVDKSVLLVGDDNRKVTDILAENGWNVTLVRNLEDAVHRAGEHPFRLVLIDLSYDGFKYQAVAINLQKLAAQANAETLFWGMNCPDLLSVEESGLDDIVPTDFSTGMMESLLNKHFS